MGTSFVERKSKFEGTTRSTNSHGYRILEKFATTSREKMIFKKITLSPKNKYTASYNSCVSYISYIFASGFLLKLIY